MPEAGKPTLEQVQIPCADRLEGLASLKIRLKVANNNTRIRPTNMAQANNFGNFLTSVLIFRLACILGGCFLAYLGYRLYIRGIFSNEGNLETRFQGFSLSLTRVGPGTFFALFGLALAGLGVFRQAEFASQDSAAVHSVQSSEVLAPQSSIEANPSAISPSAQNIHVKMDYVEPKNGTLSTPLDSSKTKPDLVIPNH